MSIFCVWIATCILCDESSQQFSTERIKKATVLKPCDADSLFLDISLLNIHYSWLWKLCESVSFISQDHFVNLFDLSAPKYQVYTPSSKLSRTTGSIRETWGKYTRSFPRQKTGIISSLCPGYALGFPLSRICLSSLGMCPGFPSQMQQLATKTVVMGNTFVTVSKPSKINTAP